MLGNGTVRRRRQDQQSQCKNWRPGNDTATKHPQPRGSLSVISHHDDSQEQENQTASKKQRRQQSRERHVKDTGSDEAKGQKLRGKAIEPNKGSFLGSGGALVRIRFLFG